VRQRNDSGSVLHVSAWPTDLEPDRSPRDVGPAEEIDFPELLGGFTSLQPPEPEPAADPPAVEAAAKPKTRSKGTAADGAEGGDPR
jgi:hypothetical protein